MFLIYFIVQIITLVIALLIVHFILHNLDKIIWNYNWYKNKIKGWWKNAKM